MLKAILFDFNGVIINDEPLHFAAMRETVAEFGVDLSREDYWNKYLPLDDRGCLEAIARDYALVLSNEKLRNALRRKSNLYRDSIRDGVSLFPGAAEFIRAAAPCYSLAIVSGAQRQEIETTLESTGLRSYFVEIVGAEDFVLGKPHPESFLFALRRLNAALHTAPVQPRECLVIEDSVGGVEGARAAGMICLAVTNSYPRRMLESANVIVNSLREAPVNDLIPWLREFL